MNEEIEIWKTIAPGKYAINKLGQVMSLERIDKLGRKQGGFLLKQVVGRAGYYSVVLRIERKQTRHFVHRLVATAFIPNPENKKCINHINSNRLDNSISNLEWVTYSENNSHAHRFGFQRLKYGELHHCSKLTREKVAQIRSKYKKHSYTMPMLASEFNVSKGAIQSILNNRTWQ